MAHLVAPRAVADLDDIWIYVARESGSIDLANHFVDSITEHFYALARFPYLGRMREEDLGPGHRSLAVGEYVIVYRVEGEDAFILRVVHGKRYFEGLFGA